MPSSGHTMRPNKCVLSSRSPLTSLQCLITALLIVVAPVDTVNEAEDVNEAEAVDEAEVADEAEAAVVFTDEAKFAEFDWSSLDLSRSVSALANFFLSLAKTNCHDLL